MEIEIQPESIPGPGTDQDRVRVSRSRQTLLLPITSLRGGERRTPEGTRKDSRNEKSGSNTGRLDQVDINRSILPRQTAALEEGLFFQRLLERIEVVIIRPTVGGMVVPSMIVSRMVVPLVVVLGVIMSGVTIMIMPRRLTGGHGNGEKRDDKRGDQFHFSVVRFRELIAVHSPITNTNSYRRLGLLNGGTTRLRL